MARPRKIVDPVQVEKMASIGCTAKEIGILLGVSQSTIERRYAIPLTKGNSKLCHALKRALFREATRPACKNPMALIFAAKVYCGMREPREDAVTVNVSQTAVSITDETKKRLAEMHELIRRETLIGSCANGEHN